MTRDHINPIQWQQSLGLARQACARIFRDGGRPADALTAFGLTGQAADELDWSRTVDIVAEALATTAARAPALRLAA